MILQQLGLPDAAQPLPRPVIDAHTHLDSTQAKSGLNPDDAVELARQANVVKVVHVACNLDEIRWAADYVSRAAGVVGCLALHPNDVARHPEQLDEAMPLICELARTNDRIRAVGETGLDYFRTLDGQGRLDQQRGFRAHIGLAKELGLALVIHDRDAHDDVARILDEEGWPERTVFHCFSADAEFARRCLEHDAYLSFPGTLTYKANAAMREALAIVPGNRLLVETDAPYLAPVPVRGKNNSSYLIPHTVRAMALVRDEPLEQLCDTLYRNAEEAFGGSW